jgi:hypothetical protein
MEEASLDHGLDRLPFFNGPHPVFFLLISFFLCPFASATTFGPITVAYQVKSANYVVHGRIVGASWVAAERESGRPYTYWKLAVIDQPKGPSLGSEVTIREPGGEIGGLGYHVAGTAQFRGGEEVFVSLKDTSEPGAKEVVGLVSGKYTVEKSENGGSEVRSGLGFLLRDPQGHPFSPEAFHALVKRIAEGNASPSDLTVFVNKEVAHEPEPEPFVNVGPRSGNRGGKAPLPQKETGAATSPLQKEEKAQTSVQPTSAPAEEKEGSFPPALWILAGLAVLAGAVYLLKR